MSSACSPSRSPCGWSPTPPRRRLAALGDSARLGRGATPVRGCAAGVLLLPVLVAALAARRCPIALRRDIGAGAPAHDEPPIRGCSCCPRRRPSRCAASWASCRLVRGLGVFALIIGVISDSFVSGLSRAARTSRSSDGGDDAVRLPGLLLPLLRAGDQPFRERADRRHARGRTEQRLETLLALPVSRARWFAGACCWRPRRRRAGAGGRRARLGRRGLAGCGRLAGGDARGRPQLPAGTVLFLALGALAFALVPRAGASIAYGLVVVAFLWEPSARCRGARWTWISRRSTTRPRARPVVPAGGAVALLAIGALAGLAGARCFERRDLAGA